MLGQEKMGYNEQRDAFESYMKERFMYGEKKQPLTNLGKSKLDKKINAWLKELFTKKKRNEHATGGISNHFKLKEGGNIRLQPHTASDLLVQETSSGERPKYQPPGHQDAPVGGPPGGGATSEGSGRDYSPPPTRAPDFVTGGGGTKTTTTKDTGPKDGPDPHGGDWERGWLNKDLRKNLETLEDPDKNRREKEQALVWLDQHDKKIAASEKARGKSSLASNIIKGIVTLGTAGAGAGLFGKDLMKVAKLYNNYKKAKQFKTAWDTGKFKIANKEFNLSNIKNKLTSSDQKLMASLPKGHPERIALEAQMKVRTPPTDDRDGATTSIKIEDIETVNDANAEQVQLKKYQEMEWAAYLAQLEQQKLRAKQMAYWKQMMAPYMAARGGRVPGYNTGGLSNLFRLKNR